MGLTDGICLGFCRGGPDILDDRLFDSKNVLSAQSAFTMMLSSDYDSLVQALKDLEVGFVLLVQDLHLLGVQHGELHHLLHRERRLSM